MFNRMIILVPMAITLMLGANNYDSMLVENGYKPVGENIKDVQRLKYGLCFFFLYALTLLVMVCST